MTLKLNNMKNIFYILILILFPTILGGQEYLNYSSSWKEYSVGCGGGNPYCTSNDFTISLIGDTIINNKTYYKTYMSGVRTTWDWTVDTLVEEIQISNLFEPIREENGVFYRYKSFINDEVILHDFNLSIGDTAVSTCSSPQIVETIDTIIIGNIARKRYFFEGNIVNHLIEGVGSTKGLFSTPCSAIGIEGGSILQCFFQDDQYLQLDTAIVCGNMTSTLGHDENFIQIEIYPNPVRNYLNLEFKNWQEGNVQLQIINLEGVVLYSNNDINPTELKTLNVGYLPNGLYIVKIGNDKVKVIRRIIKIN